MKYEVNVGSFVTRLMTRKYIISAKSQEEAYQKAEEKLRLDCQKLKVWTECGDTVILNSCQEIREVLK